MARALLLLAAGVLAGASAVYLVLQGHDRAGSGPAAGGASDGEAVAALASAPAPSPQASADAGAAGNGAAPSGASARLALYESIAAITDRFDLESRIVSLAVEPRSRARDAELSALLLRLAELGPDQAARFAWSWHLDARHLVPLFNLWAATDPDAALAELGRLSPAAEVRELALGMLEVFGNDARGVARVADALPVADRSGFEIEAMAARAARDPGAALADLVGVQVTEARRFGGARVAAAAVRVDPLQALEQGAMLDSPSSRTAYLAAVVRNWTEVDPEGVFAWLEALAEEGLGADPVGMALREGPLMQSLFQQIADSDPERLLSMSDRLPANFRSMAQRAGLQALASIDAVGALARIDLMPPGQERTMVMQTLARTWGREDPGAALAWARSLSPPSPQVVSSVVQGIAAVDIDYAIDLAVEGLQGQGGSMTNADFLMAGALSSIAMSRAFAGTMDSAETARVANRLLALDAPAARSAASSMIAAWAQADPEAALDWVVANANRLDAFPLSTVSQQAVRSDAERAIGMLDSLAGDARAQWLQGVASGLASRSIDQAAAFLQDHRGEPGFEQALTAVALSGRHEPEAAARLLAQAGSSPALGRAAGVVANAWVQRDPERAAAWALGLGDTEASSSAIASVAGGWARQDSDAARQWVQRLPTGQARDRALDGYLFATANAGALDTSVLSSFSSDAVRQQAMSRAIVQLGRQDPRQARVLLDRWITDPQLHSRTEEGLATTGGAGGLVIRFP